MKRIKLQKLSVEQLVQLFAELSVQQDMATMAMTQRDINRLYWKIKAVSEELKARPGVRRFFPYTITRICRFVSKQRMRLWHLNQNWGVRSLKRLRHPVGNRRPVTRECRC